MSSSGKTRRVLKTFVPGAVNFLKILLSFFLAWPAKASFRRGVLYFAVRDRFMMTLDDFRNCVVVVAHPDDEILWASSLLAVARKIILCYGESPGYPAVGAGRRALLKEFPLETVVSLDIAESDVHLSANWAHPVETAYGIEVSRNGDAYAKRFHLLREALEAHLEEGDIVVTHNPWGEYGHEEHVQVHRAVADVRQRLNFRLFVTGYVGEGESEDLIGYELLRKPFTVGALASAVAAALARPVNEPRRSGGAAAAG